MPEAVLVNLFNVRESRIIGLMERRSWSSALWRGETEVSLITRGVLAVVHVHRCSADFLHVRGSSGKFL